MRGRSLSIPAPSLGEWSDCVPWSLDSLPRATGKCPLKSTRERSQGSPSPLKSHELFSGEYRWTQGSLGACVSLNLFRLFLKSPPKYPLGDVGIQALLSQGQKEEGVTVAASSVEALIVKGQITRLGEEALPCVRTRGHGKRRNRGVEEVTFAFL